jgi:hypothetical protein
LRSRQGDSTRIVVSSTEKSQKLQKKVESFQWSLSADLSREQVGSRHFPARARIDPAKARALALRLKRGETDASQPTFNAYYEGRNLLICQCRRPRNTS